MKFLALFLTYLICLNSFAAPMGVSGQNQSNKYPSVIKTPNNQATDIGSSSSLLETGNKNRLVNPGFEHSTFSTGWNTSVTGTATITPAVETTSPLEGKKSGKYTCAGGASGGTCTISQDVTTTHTPQGVAALYVKSDTVWSPSTSTGVQVFSRKDGVNFQSKNVDVTSDKLFSIPVTLSSVTSTGVAAVITVAASQTIIVFLDEGYVGAADLKQDFSPVGPWIDYGAMTITATTTAPTKATTREKDNVRCRVNGQDYECIYEYAAASATGAAAGSGGYIFSLPAGIAIDSSVITTPNIASFGSYVGSRANASIGYGDAEITGVTGDTSGKCDVGATSSTTFQVNCFTGAAANSVIGSINFAALTNAGIGWKFTLKFKGAGLASNYSSYSTNDYPFSTDSAVLAFASSASYTISNLNTAPIGTFITYSYASSTNTRTQCTTAPTQTTADMNANGIQLFTRAYNAASTCASPAIVAINLGTGYDSVSALAFKSSGKSTPGSFLYAIEGAVEYGSFSNGFNPYTGVYLLDVGSNFQSTTTVHSINFQDFTQQTSAYAVITGVKSKNTTIGQFNGLESCTDSYQCTDTFSAKVSSADTVSDENLEWITGNCTDATTGQATCTFKTGLFTVAPNCSATFNGTPTSNIGVSIQSISASSVVIRAEEANSFADRAFNISCQKTGADAVFKTARAVASDQNIATPGVTKAVVFGATINNTTLTNNEGGFITSSSCSSGSYTVNLTGLASVSRCNATVQDAGVLPLSPFNFVKSSSSVTFKTSNNSGTGVCYTVDLTCNGVKQ